jgi:hypothetical protein
LKKLLEILRGRVEGFGMSKCNVSFQCGTGFRDILDTMAEKSGGISRSEYIVKILEKAVIDDVVIDTEVHYRTRETEKPRGLLGRKRIA